MKKCYISSLLLVCLITCFMSTNLIAQVKSPGSNQELPDVPTTNIIGGTNTNINVIPWQILLEISGQDGCGGTIVAPNWIVTAAHCLEGRTASQLRV